MAQNGGQLRHEKQRQSWLWRWGIDGWLLIGIAGAIVVLGMAYSRAHQVVIPMVMAVILGVLLSPLVDSFTRFRFPRWLGAMITLILIIAVFAGFLAVVVYGVSTQAGAIGKQIKKGNERINAWFDNLKVSKGVVNWVHREIKKTWPHVTGGLTKWLTQSVHGLASFLIGLLIGIFILFFILNDDGTIRRWVAGKMAAPAEQADAILNEVFSSIRGYFKGATIIAAVNAIIIIPVVLLLRVPLFGAISLVTFVTCYIPAIGGYIGGAFAVFVALASRGLTAGLIMLAFVILAHTVLQNPIQAIAYGKTLNMHPIVTLLVTMLGLIFFGIFGAILAVPITAVVSKVLALLRCARESEDKPPDEECLSPLSGSPGPSPEEAK